MHNKVYAEQLVMTTEETNFLTPQELTIVRLIAQGAKTNDMAREMDLKAETIKWYRKRILDKFCASTSAEVVCKAKELNIL